MWHGKRAQRADWALSSLFTQVTKIPVIQACSLRRKTLKSRKKPLKFDIHNLLRIARWPKKSIHIKNNFFEKNFVVVVKQGLCAPESCSLLCRPPSINSKNFPLTNIRVMIHTCYHHLELKNTFWVACERDAILRARTRSDDDDEVFSKFSWFTYILFLDQRENTNILYILNFKCFFQPQGVFLTKWPCLDGGDFGDSSKQRRGRPAGSPNCLQHVWPLCNMASENRLGTSLAHARAYPSIGWVCYLPWQITWVGKITWPSYLPVICHYRIWLHSTLQLYASHPMGSLPIDLENN